MSEYPPLWQTIGLEGMQLIEASAGTGKTHNLVEIYKRILKEENADIENILIVTFTKAATEDIRKKVRKGLLEAIKEDGQKDPDMLARLRKAAERMNEAPIFTIHAFSLKATEELAFESGVLFDRGDQVDDEAIFREVCCDYWRFQTIGRCKDWVAYVQDKFKNPDLFHEKLKLALQKPSADVVGLNLKGVLDLANEVRSLWQAEGFWRAKSVACEVDKRGEKVDQKGKNTRKVDQEGKNKGGILSGNMTLGSCAEAAGGFVNLIGELDRTLKQAEIPLSFPGWLQSFTKYAWPDLLNKGYEDIPPPFSDGFRSKLLSLRDWVASGAFLFKDALENSKERARAIKRERRLFSYADMIEDLYEALCHINRGRVLSQDLAGIWPYMLVDEFQDTDPRQYEILKAIHQGEKSKTLVMIGDPKQAIYSFRGADVFAYLRAAKDAKASKDKVLKVNHRSSPGIIAALNRLFRGDPNPFILEKIAYKEAECLHENRKIGIAYGQKSSAPALTVWELQPKEGKGSLKARQARKELLEACLEQVVRLLDQTAGLEIREKDKQDPIKQRRIVPGDIAVLVGTNAQASMVQKGLAKRGVPSVCLHQQSVFKTDEAEEVFWLLKAAASPTDDRAVKSALVSLLLGKTLDNFASFAEDPETFEKERDLFKDAKDRWERAGVLAMLFPFIQKAAPSVLSMGDGERRMSNYLQLAELLAEAEAANFGTEGLIRYLDRAMREGGGDAAQIRLESDEDFVKISTVHKAKGLEYGIVFLPFASFFGVGKNSPESPPYYYHDDEGKAKVAYQKDPEEGSKRAVREHKAEAVRLLYVAFTRAKYAIYLGHGPINTTQNGALAWVLHRAEEGMESLQTTWDGNKKNSGWLTKERVHRRLDELKADPSGMIAIESPPIPSRQLWQPQAKASLEGARDDLPREPKPWRITSFSSLSLRSRPIAVESGGEDEPLDPILLETAKPILPRGRAFGNAFHAFMEKADFKTLACPKALEDRELLTLAKESLDRFGVRSLDGVESEQLTKAFLGCAQATVCEPLPGLGLALKDIEKGAQVREMEFFFRLGQKSTAKDLFDALKRQGIGQGFRGDSNESLSGLMNGFIDLTFQIEGRYYILDYKTNDLDLLPQGYTKEGVEAAMMEHAYDLQYTIYLTALHRYLKAHLEGYTPERLGGVYYLFVRGLNGSGERGVFSLKAMDHSAILEIDGLLDKGASQ